MRRIHGLLAAESVIIVLLSWNRWSDLTRGYVASNEFLRWVELNNLLVLPLLSIVAFFLLKKQVERDGAAREGSLHVTLSGAFVVGTYLLGAGYGDHEVTNYLHTRFCGEGVPGPGALCEIIIFNDDVFSHWVFFAGFVLINGSLMLLQALFPHPRRLTGRDRMLLGANGLVVGLAIFANLAFEDLGADLGIVALLAVVAWILLWHKGGQPLLIYYAVGYTLGLAATLLYRAAA